MSGVLLSVAFYAILRVQAIAGAAVGPELMRAARGGRAVVAGGDRGAVITQKDFKRLLAYSSIEHMACWRSVRGRWPALALCCCTCSATTGWSSMFVLAGRVLRFTGSHHIADVRNLLQRRQPGGPFLLARPRCWASPFVTFFTEVAILVAGFQRAWVADDFACPALAVFAESPGTPWP